MTTATAPPTEATNAELVRWAFDKLNEHDVTPLKQFWTAETIERFPDRTCHGGDEIARYFEDTFAAMPDFHMDVQAVVEQGEDIFVHWHLTGTHQGPIQGIAPTGKPVAIDGMDHFLSKAPSMKASMERGGEPGEFELAVLEATTAWLKRQLS